MNIGFLGLGIMGSRMAANLIRAGHRLTVWNRSADKADALVEAGAQLAATPAEAARYQDAVITMLANPQAVEHSALGPDGFLNQMKPGALWMDSSTVNPSFSRRMAAEAAQRKVRFVDAPVTGSKEAAGKAQLLFIVGGEPGDLEELRPLMEKMGRGFIHVGETGMGSSLKVVNNMMVAQAMMAFSEGLVLAEGLGISREKMFEVFTGQAAAAVAPLATSKRAKIESGSYEADFPLQWMQKDLELAALTAYEKGLALPAANTVKEIFMLAARYGLAEHDFSAIYEFLRQKQPSK